MGVIDPPHLTKELLYAVFLPGLVFEAAFHLDFQKFWQNKVAISSLAVPGVAAAIGLTSILLQPGPCAALGRWLHDEACAGVLCAHRSY